jgi:RNA polymerase sigma factor (sigma-70 family)
VARQKFDVPDSDCESLVQEALCSYLTTSGPIENPRAWLVGAVCNASRHYWRDRIRRNKIEGTRIDDFLDVSHEMDIERLERAIFIRELLDGLRPGAREVLRLHYFEGRTATEVATALGTSVRYAEKRIFKALQEARRKYERLRRRPKGASVVGVRHSQRRLRVLPLRWEE